MTGPFYVSPEQQMKDRADFARKGIGRGRAVVVLRYADGICFVAENPSATLHKVSEIYDRIGFAAVGRYHEFETLRVAGIQQADVRGFTYDRADVSARTLVNAYAQWLGTVFASVNEKPLEVELVLAEVADDPATDRVYRITYDGSVFDERTFCAMGGSSEAITAVVGDAYDPAAPLPIAVQLAANALRQASEADAGAPVPLEVAVLDRTRGRRKFRRLGVEAVQELLR